MMRFEDQHFGGTPLTSFTSKMSDLASLRQRIDSLDTTLVELLNERARVSLNIGAAKRKAKNNGYVCQKFVILPCSRWNA